MARLPGGEMQQSNKQFAIFQAATLKTSLQTSCLYIRCGKLDTKWRKRKAGKKTQGLLWMVISSTKRKIPTRVYSPFTFVLSESVFCQGVIVLLNPVCVLLSVECFMFKSDVRVAVFET